MLEAKFGKEYARSEALNDIVGEVYFQAINEHELDVIAQPQVPEQRRLVEIGELDHVFHTSLAQVLSGAHLRKIPS